MCCRKLQISDHGLRHSCGDVSCLCVAAEARLESSSGASKALETALQEASPDEVKTALQAACDALIFGVEGRYLLSQP